ncbi:MAG: histidine kinase [Rhodospirillaceae bacterium]|nr:histidine kinase [Rhodospirillaceae bacterium]
MTESNKRQDRRKLSRLTLRILAINLFAVAILFVGVLYLDRYQNSLIQAELEALSQQATLFSRALGEIAVEFEPSANRHISVEIVHRMVRRSSGATPTRARVFGPRGEIIADSQQLRRHGGMVQIRPLPPLRPEIFIRELAERVYEDVVNWFPRRSGFPIHFEIGENLSHTYPEVLQALRGVTVETVRATKAGGLVLTVAVPIQKYKQVLGALLLSLEGEKIDQAVRSVRLEILGVFAAVFAVTVALSLYLAGSITRPVQRLAAAAERVRTDRNRQHGIPEFADRHDEIGDLARAMREMTDNLWQRMDAIERFTADVAHEIKNPLTSVRSAVETAIRVNDPGQRTKLFAIILDDVNRLDKLISDISEASRVDAELSREETTEVDISLMLATLTDVYTSDDRISGYNLVCEIHDDGNPLLVSGNQSRLAQVIRNLVENATTFSPDDGQITICASSLANTVTITVEDEGTGIPEGKLEAIFDRFYSERPSGEKFGTHSGLGLSICKQIIEAHGGRIRAQNRRAADGSVLGARFTITIPTIINTIKPMSD